jgi:hypothetical protein
MSDLTMFCRIYKHGFPDGYVAPIRGGGFQGWFKDYVSCSIHTANCL